MKVFYTNQHFDPTLPEGEVETIFDLKKYVDSPEFGSYIVDEYTGEFAYNWLIEESGVEDYLVEHIDYFLLGKGRVIAVLTSEGESMQDEQQNYWD